MRYNDLEFCDSPNLGMDVATSKVLHFHETSVLRNLGIFHVAFHSFQVDLNNSYILLKRTNFIIPCFLLKCKYILLFIENIETINFVVNLVTFIEDK